MKFGTAREEDTPLKLIEVVDELMIGLL